MWGKFAFRVALFVGLLATFWIAPARQAEAVPVRQVVVEVKVCSISRSDLLYIPGDDFCSRLNSLPTLSQGTICSSGGRTYFADSATCPSSAKALPQVYRCSALGVGVYAGNRALCRSVTVDARTQTEIGTVRRYGPMRGGIDLGVSAGANVYSPNFGFLRGFDSLAAPAVRTDQRDIGLGNTSAMLGFDVTAWTPMPVTPLTPNGTRVFLQTSFMFPINSSTSETVTGVNVIPQGTVTTEYKSNYQIGVFGGFSYDLRNTLGIPSIGMLVDPRLRIGGGVVFNNRKITVSGTDTSGVAFNSSRTSTDTEPAFLIGIKGNVGQFMVGLDVINSFPCGISTTAQSGFPSQTYKGATGDGVNTTAKVTLSKQVWAGDPY